MDTMTAKGLISIIRNYSNYAAVKTGAFKSYYDGHDDKHRSRDTAYMYYTNGGTCGFYQKSRDVQELGGPIKDVVVVRMKDPTKGKVWGNQETVTVKQQDLITVKKYDQDIDKDDDAKIVYNAFILGDSQQSYYQDSTGAADKFVLVCPLAWEAWRGFTYQGPGKTKDNPEACANMALVLVGGTSCVQLVTHYPISASSLANLQPLG